MFSTQMERQKQALLEAYCKLGLALAQPYLPGLINPCIPPPSALADGSAPSYTDVTIPPPPSVALLKELDGIATTVLKLVEPTDGKVTG